MSSALPIIVAGLALTGGFVNFAIHKIEEGNLFCVVRARHQLIRPYCPMGKNFFGYSPPNLSLARLATDMRCLL